MQVLINANDRKKNDFKLQQKLISQAGPKDALHTIIGISS